MRLRVKLLIVRCSYVCFVGFQATNCCQEYIIHIILILCVRWKNQTASSEEENDTCHVINGRNRHPVVYIFNLMATYGFTRSYELWHTTTVHP
ncbi:hypothetical protein ZWY2020_046357 [Hordeum vulgare]|nr:hypothetical protein ZWY2020_010604 [Hordeum vulgare]KAI4969027.1 hypothetical protein ZWY2020_046357 [Hordeum vulgare]